MSGDGGVSEDIPEFLDDSFGGQAADAMENVNGNNILGISERRGSVSTDSPQQRASVFAQFKRSLNRKSQFRTVDDATIIFKVIHRNPFFRKFSAQKLRTIAWTLGHRIAQTGEEIYSERDTTATADWFVIMDGEVTLTMKGNPIATLVPGNSFGEHDLRPSASERRPVTAVAAKFTFMIKLERSEWTILSAPSSAVNEDAMKRSESVDNIGSFVRDALEKPPTKRSAEEMSIIVEVVRGLPAFKGFSATTIEQLCNALVFEEVEKNKTTVFLKGDEGTSWYVIFKGSVKVVVSSAEEFVLSEGKSFGDWALVNDTPRSATVITNEPNCQFLKLDKYDYNRILKSVEQNTVRLSEYGHVVLILENRVAKGEETPRFVVTAGTIDKLYERLFDQTDPTYAEDFLLVYRTFMSNTELIKRLTNSYPPQWPLCLMLPGTVGGR
eukprot:Opistho-2@35576